MEQTHGNQDLGGKNPVLITVTVIQGTDCTSFPVRKGDNLLMAMVQAGYPVTFMCTTGKCTTCQMKMDIPAGSANIASETERYRLGNETLANGIRLTCQVYVHGPLTVFLP
ncbi:2Fe-2S iron-sulfur cluster-binding protein [Brevibacillus sp. SYSU BS000544]|uniref:2Fe-2S iron-sulfur cluster-binding protein n=1 Tax=Brevibacillus sp. SYSU BS000544 TaxID=3416443 RepID=UPI003CE4DB48